MTKELAIYQQFDALQKASNALYKSGYFKDVTSEAQAIVKVLAGAELGLPPFASMAGINIIQGKPALGANVIATLVKNDPRYNYRIQKSDDTTCIIEWFEDGKSVGTAGFTMDEAKRAGLTGKDNWNKYPSDMLFARAITRGARRFAPGIFGGAPVYTPEELGADTDEEGYVTVQAVDVTPGNGKPAPEPVELPSGDMSLEMAESTLNSKGQRYGDLDTEVLSHMARELAKALKAPDCPDRETRQFKLDAARKILFERAKA